ncbi:MAG TPA: protein translocase subunit SecD [Solirubrobacteraceae bacterium]|nr:protein translocase subunit SecD [Solirubrobacteraceae bacterium]
MTDRQRHGFILLLVAGLIAASVFVIATQRTILGLDLKGGVQLVYQGEPTAQSGVTQAALNRAVDIMRSRVDQLGVSQPEIQTDGGKQISVGLPDVTDINRAEQEVGNTASLFFFDWEANALTPNGKTVASQLLTQDPTALTISQGGGLGPGLPGGGSTSLYQAVQLASKQPTAPVSKSLSRPPGRQYYLFGAPGSAACTAAAKHFGTTVVQGTHCLLVGPDNEAPTATRAKALQDLAAGLPPGVTMSEGQVLVVPQGTVVLQAANPSASQQIKFASPTAEFYVLKDNVALTGKDITNPTEGTDQSGAPDVQFGFTGSGASRFQSVTGQIAHRGANVSLGGRTLDQHFAVALGGISSQLVTVPSIDYKQYPDGIIESGGGSGADITGGFTSQSASDLATELRLGALPINLKLISESRVSATLGAQALHQGLIAGAVGLLVVALFLVAYYRALGLIAVAGLAVYALYFYALIKLIPVTLTLPGIAGLILTIGVAADANIVIFERVKEEIRAGRSIRAGIVTGYRKGLTAIIDANVVTIMTAFILFVLATAEVQGFAFTLGIGVIVSLFTAVMATQAILMTMSDSRTIARPSALGAGGKKREWRFDFMGASKYFFSMSGVILLIGALAIGGRGLNLGIDFTSGTRITTTLVHPATATQVSAVAGKAGAVDPQVQRVGNTGDTFQISSKPVNGGTGAIQTALQAKFGIKTNNGTLVFDSTTVGPTFGRTVANSAVIAIIASLLVISAYVALRFDWKFAVPTLIALMHDVLITSGVYALTGRQVTVDTVAALLTILGYSLYDTIIVFDRVRENIPRMPRAAFSQVVNRSMSEVLTRSIATTSCTLLPIIALLLFGGSTLQDFAFALLIGVASGAYSSIFIASPVLTHWKEREPVYRHRRHRLETEYGFVAPYATTGADVEPTRDRRRRPSRRMTEPEPDTVSAAEFEQMKRDIAEEEAEPSRRTSTLTQRLARSQPTEPQDTPPAPGPGGRPARGGRAARGGAGGTTQRGGAGGAAQRGGGGGAAQRGGAGDAGGTPSPSPAAPVPPAAQPPQPPQTPPGEDGREEPEFRHAPDEAENDAMPQTPKPARSAKSRSRNRRHGRRR